MSVNVIKSDVPLEVLAESIVSISDGVKKLRSGRLKESALLLLIQHAAPSPKRGRYRTGVPIPLKTIKAVLDGMEALKTEFVK
jgi:hypothetical protein